MGGVRYLRVSSVLDVLREVLVVRGRGQAVVLADDGERRRGYLVEAVQDVEGVTATEVAAGDAPTDVVHPGFRQFDVPVVGVVEELVLAVQELDRAVEVAVEPREQVVQDRELRAAAGEHDRLGGPAAFEEEVHHDRAAERVADERRRAGLASDGVDVGGVRRQRTPAGVGVHVVRLAVAAQVDGNDRDRRGESSELCLPHLVRAAAAVDEQDGVAAGTAVGPPVGRGPTVVGHRFHTAPSLADGIKFRGPTSVNCISTPKQGIAVREQPLLRKV